MAMAMAMEVPLSLSLTGGRRKCCFFHPKTAFSSFFSAMPNLQECNGFLAMSLHPHMSSRKKMHGYYRRLRVCATLADIVTDEQSRNNLMLPKGEAWSVHKFGGTCVSTWEKLWSVSNIIAKDRSAKKIVIVSAMSNVTDMLYNLLERAQNRDSSYELAIEDVYKKHEEVARALLSEGVDVHSFLACLKEDIQNLGAMLQAIYIAGHATDSFAAYVLGYGEIWSAQMLAAAVQKRGLPCKWMDTRDVLVVNPTGANQVDPDFIASEERLEAWYSQNPVDTIIATGFIASTPENIPITLRRDGSDFSATIMGALMRAGQVTIWTDVDGIYSANPQKVTEAVLLHNLSYQEAWEMSYFGANVLHPQTIIPAMRFNIPIVIRNAFNLSSPGTKICRAALPDPSEASAGSVVKGFATIDNIALINVEGTGMVGVPGMASDIFRIVKDVGANVVMISQASSEHSVCFAVPEDEATLVADALGKRFEIELDAGRLSRVEVVKDCSILATVGQQMASTPGVSASLFSALAKANINIRAIAQGCSEYNITIVIEHEDSIKALKAVHSRFYLSKTTIALGIIGPGLIGKTLIEQLKDQASVLKEEFNIDLRVMGIMGSKTMLLNHIGIDLCKWKQLLIDRGECANLEKFTDHLKSNHSIPNTAIVDCTASVEIAASYYSCLKKGIHIITPNKKANSGPLDQYLRLRALQRESYTHYFYEGTVGAGLPIISTLRGLLETGDKIQRIEGIFSGTLSYIFNNFIGDKSFSQIVAEARAAGYTEPDPRDDLSGMDVARKVIILARESGLKLDLEDIPVQSLVPAPLESVSSGDEFLARLPEHDAAIEHERQAADISGEVLRYVGVVDVLAKRGSVELRRYPKAHAFAQLSGSDNIIAFTTTRYNKQPLIVRGPGAGAEVTAAGVFSDILRLASYLGAPS